MMLIRLASRKSITVKSPREAAVEVVEAVVVIDPKVTDPTVTDLKVNAEVAVVEIVPKVNHANNVKVRSAVEAAVVIAVVAEEADLELPSPRVKPVQLLNMLNAVVTGTDTRANLARKLIPSTVRTALAVEDVETRRAVMAEAAGVTNSPELRTAMLLPLKVKSLVRPNPRGGKESQEKRSRLNPS